MITRIFEMSDEPVESAPPLQVSIAVRILGCVWASAVSVIPALAATYSALLITRFFSSLKNAEAATSANVFAHLHTLNTIMVITLGVSAFLALGFALFVAIEPQRRLASVGLPLSIGIPLLAATPALFLWFAETTTINVFYGQPAQTTIASTAETVSQLLFAAMVSGPLVAAATFVFSILSLCIPIKSRTDQFSLRRAFVWAVTGILLLVFAGAYFFLV